MNNNHEKGFFLCKNYKNYYAKVVGISYIPREINKPTVSTTSIVGKYKTGLSPRPIKSSYEKNAIIIHNQIGTLYIPIFY